MAERTCIATGKTLPRHNRRRFVAGPDGVATLDLAEKLPRRGAWLAAANATLAGGGRWTAAFRDVSGRAPDLLGAAEAAAAEAGMDRGDVCRSAVVRKLP